MTLYRFYLLSHIFRGHLGPAQSTVQPSGPTKAGREENPSMIYGDHRYSYVISGRQDFETENDAAALSIARIIFDAATDVCDTFELWDGTRQIDQSRVAILQTNVVCAERQEHVIQTEEALLHSDWAIARSRRLLARFNEFREQSMSGDDSLA